MFSVSTLTTLLGAPVTGTLAPILRRTLRPAVALMSRLRYAQKFLLLGLVMVVPLAWVVTSYLGVQSNGTSFADAEKAFTEALAIARELASRNPDIYQPQVILTLSSLGLF